MSDELGRRAFFTKLFARGVQAAEKAIPQVQQMSGPMPSFAALTFPKRQLGNTSEWVPIISLGTARLGRDVGDDVAALVLNKAVDNGINVIVTGPDACGYGRAQLQVARALGSRRDEIFLATSVFEADAQSSWRMLQENLAALRMDRVDVLFAHGIGTDKMADTDGVFDTLQRAKEQGIARFIGLTGYCRPDRMLRAIADHDVDVILTAVNYVDAHTYGFEKRIWPFAHRKGIGIAAMNVVSGMAEDRKEAALRYTLGLEGCATAVLNVGSVDELEQNITLARAYSPLTEGEQEALLTEGESLAVEWGEHLGPAD